MICFKLKKKKKHKLSVLWPYSPENTKKTTSLDQNTNIFFVIPTTWQFHNFKKITKLWPSYRWWTKKAQILLRNVVYSSHYNKRHSNGGETSVCLYVCFTMVVLLRLFLAKPLCRCVQYAISSGGIITLTLEYLKERLFTVVQCLDFEDHHILTVFSISIAG